MRTQRLLAAAPWHRCGICVPAAVHPSVHVVVLPLWLQSQHLLMLCNYIRSSVLTGITLCFMQAGCEPILHMRHFQKAGSLSEKLVQDIISRNS